MNQEKPDLDPDHETAELRKLMISTGVSAHLDQEVSGIEFESAESMLARLKANEPRTVLSQPRVRTLLVGTAAAIIAGVVVVIQPWNSPVARAETPPILDFEFAEAQRVADAPGVDPGRTLEQLATAAERQATNSELDGVQHVVLEGWTIDPDFDPDPNSTITPTRTENWLYADGRFRTRASKGEPLRADGRGVPHGGSLDRSTEFRNEESEPAGSRDAQYFYDMPDSVPGVRRAMLDNIQCLERRRGQERTFCLTDELHNMAQTHVIPPQTMANIWRMLAQEEGLRSLGRVKDRTGSEAVAISFIWVGAPEYRLVLLADPDTGEFVGHERILIKPTDNSPVEPPAIQQFLAIVRSELQ